MQGSALDVVREGGGGSDKALTRAAAQIQFLELPGGPSNHEPCHAFRSLGSQARTPTDHRARCQTANDPCETLKLHREGAFVVRFAK